MARIDHTNCTHPRTPAGRKECRDLGGPAAYALEHARPRASVRPVCLHGPLCQIHKAGGCDPRPIREIKSSVKVETGTPVEYHCSSCGRDCWGDDNDGYSSCCSEVIVMDCTSGGCVH